jgi:hypothetical protein
VARMESVRLILAMAVHEGWRIHHMDVKLAFLNGSLEEVVYVQQSPGFSVGEQSQVLRLKKTLYGLRQTPRAWYSKLHVSLTSLGFVCSDHKHAVYTKRTVSKPLMICVYVDDLLIVGTLDSDIEVFKQEMRDWFKMRDLELLSYYLGIEVRQEKSGTTLYQSTYAQKLLKKTGMGECNPSFTPMDARLQLVDATEYGSIVGALRYLVHTRPDLAHSVSYVSRFMAEPHVDHLVAAKRIMCYIAGTHP